MNIGYLQLGTEEVGNQEPEIRKYANSEEVAINKFTQVDISSRRSQKDIKIDWLMLLSDKDNLIETELSRFGRSTKEVLFLLDALKEKDVVIHVIKQKLILDKNNNDLISRLLITLLASFKELEGDLISKCTKEALKLQKESGVTLGRPKGTIGKSKLDGKEEEIQNFLKKDINKSTIAKLLNCDRNTLNNCIKSRNI